MKEQQRRELRGVIAPSGNHYVVVNFTDQMIGQVITDEETVRAPNGKWWRKEDFHLQQNKSMLRCPTYGTCNSCMSSGPMNGYCRYCNESGCTYKQMVRNYGGSVMVDAEWISHRFRATHLPAMADREVNYEELGQQSNKSFSWNISMSTLILKKKGNWKGCPADWIELDDKAKLDLAMMEASHIQNELFEEDTVGWNPTDSEATKLDPIEDLQVPVPM